MKNAMQMTSYELSRQFFDWSFENPEKVNTNHIALYFFIIEHCNRLGWKEKFGLPTTMAKEAIGIRNYRTYINTLNDLIEFGFIKLIEKSKNQYSSNIIAIVKNTKAHTKALDKARQKQLQKQVQSIDSINKQLNKEQLNQGTNENDFDLFWNSYHSISGKPKTDLQATKKYWNKLTEPEKKKAIENIKPYCDSISEKKYIKKARTYLSDKNFNDEFKTIPKTNGEIKLKDFNIPSLDHFGYSQDDLLEFCKQGKYQRL